MKVSNGLDARRHVDNPHFTGAIAFPRHTECIWTGRGYAAVSPAGPMAYCLWDESRGHGWRAAKIAFDHETAHIIMEAIRMAENCRTAKISFIQKESSPSFLCLRD